jgi:NitT/TauT family transport system permease protein
MTLVDEAELIEAEAATSVASPPRTGSPFALRALKQIVHVLWPMALLVGVWALWVEVTDMPPAVAPSPTDVFAYILKQPGTYLTDALATLLIVVGGLVLGSIAGVGLATISWFSNFARATISGPALITQCLPVATMVPVLARVFGYNQRTVVVIAALIAFFPVLVFTSSGLRSTPPGADDLFRVFGAGRKQRFFHLALPSAFPRMLVALRLSVVAAVVGAMLAQWIMGTEGLGYRLVIAQVSFRMSEAWGASVVAILLSVVLYTAVSGICRMAQERFE